MQRRYHAQAGLDMTRRQCIASSHTNDPQRHLPHQNLVFTWKNLFLLSRTPPSRRFSFGSIGLLDTTFCKRSGDFALFCFIGLELWKTGESGNTGVKENGKLYYYQEPQRLGAVHNND
ncbi:hypothetical protein CB0940_10090 [Cercospora beticola]|uniref:Uncharacterized protein n=1 Tax=Cercospora beticola TaxID=122368 RepID=A0A2G5HUC1_CERBT|nr:hypothetical protein CB0940_10090 [Cercospora beticola]PIA96144.1 hypothetical protein CB0940_10090 [Cercospora beticola]